jgi:hypothetical protein
MRRDLLTAQPRFDGQSSNSAWLSSFASAVNRVFRVLSVAVNSQRSNRVHASKQQPKDDDDETTWGSRGKVPLERSWRASEDRRVERAIDQVSEATRVMLIQIAMKRQGEVTQYQ